MKSKKIWYWVVMLGLVAVMGACGGDEGPDTPSDNFDRAAMLANWADNIIVPAYDDYKQKLDALKSSTETFVATANADNLLSLRTAWVGAILSWQNVSMFEIGPAETVTLRSFTNTYPTDTEEIEEFVTSGSFNLELPSTYDAQGLPALDYLLFGTGDDDAAVLAKLSGDSYKAYLSALSNRLWDLGNQVHEAWTATGYRDEFVSNSGSSATASVNKMVNDFLFYYEKALRAGKVGIPAGVFSGTPLSDRVEALYIGQFNKELLLNAISAVNGFYRGRYFNGTGDGPSLFDYLQSLGTQRNDGTLADAIADQFSEISRVASFGLDNDLSIQVETDNSKMLETYDELQKLVVMMKVDMFQALNIQVDFVDADGD